MDLNTKGRYAVMAMADLAKYGADGSVPLSAVAERQRLSLDYLEQIFLKLRRAGLVESTRGRLGGYHLARSAADIRILDIMLAVEEETRMTRCLGEGAGCLEGQKCLTHDLWEALGEQIDGFLAKVSLKEVLEGIPQEKCAGRSESTARTSTGTSIQ
jgi:Rrf2 family protein